MDKPSGKLSSYFGFKQFQFVSIMTPRQCRQEKRNLWLLKSNFRQYIGYFDGYVIDSDG
ncbi:hypothetical protein [Shewanella sp. AS1]|uniref:hypothetical protein n=1 Tax=Shewanella sp. AS1 TaxID=2907626 RepID=UPI003FA3835F